MSVQDPREGTMKNWISNSSYNFPIRSMSTPKLSTHKAKWVKTWNSNNGTLRTEPRASQSHSARKFRACQGAGHWEIPVFQLRPPERLCPLSQRYKPGLRQNRNWIAPESKSQAGLHQSPYPHLLPQKRYHSWFC